MPKKFVGENSKAVAARQRKAAAKEAEVEKIKKKVEDEYWKDDDKQAVKKQQRKAEQEKKKQEQQEKKAEAKALLEQELASINKNPKPAPAPKTTRYQIENTKVTAAAAKPEKPAVETHLEMPLVENVNRLQIEGEEARTVTEAISILTDKPGEVDKHPEKRMKAAYLAFEEKRLQELKLEHPSLRMSQLKQMIFKEWQKSPENPINNA